MADTPKPRSHEVTDGIGRAPARAMLRAVGMTDADWGSSQVGVASSWNEVTPCNMPLARLAQRAKDGVRAAGGFCAHHAELVLAIALRDDLTAGLAEVYEHLIAGDLARIDARPATLPAPSARCYLCIGGTEAESRMATFVADRLSADADARAAYGRSSGFCLPHLRLVAARAEPATARVLLADAAERMRALSLRLSEYRRKRDYRNAGEPKGEEQFAAIEATRRYSGG